MKGFTDRTLTVLYVGGYDEYYPRHRVLITGLKRNGVIVVERRSGGSYPVKLARFLWSLLAHGRRCDVIIVGEASNYLMPATILVKRYLRARIVFDTFVSLADTLEDKAGLSHRHPMVRLLAWLDRWNFRMADLVLTVSQGDAAYFSERFRVPLPKFSAVPVGAEDALFDQPALPCTRARTTFDVLFFGTYIPLHGIEHILEGARALRANRHIRFHLVGSGQTLRRMQTLAARWDLENVRFSTEWVPYERLPREIACADVVLGIFGDSSKASRVVPTKAFAALAMGKPLITACTPEARRHFTDGRDALLVPSGNGDALAQAITRLANSPRERTAIGKAGYELYQSAFRPEMLARSVITKIESPVAP